MITAKLFLVFNWRLNIRSGVNLLEGRFGKK